MMQGTGSDMQLRDSTFKKLCDIIHSNTGITIGENRKSMLESRLRGRLREIDESSFDSYIARLSSQSGEMQELINRVTTNETYFYRTPRVWTYFCQTVQPEFQSKELRRPMHVWSSAASTGEEAHTIGVILEDMRRRSGDFDYTVLGTDVSARVINTAKNGVYNGKSIARFQKEEPELFARHMTGNDDAGFAVSPDIKTRLKFKLHNLLTPLSGTRLFDVVFLRNVLIYFSKPDQETILNNVHQHMQPDGYLFVGESETLSQLDTPFEPVQPLIYKPSPTRRQMQ